MYSEQFVDSVLILKFTHNKLKMLRILPPIISGSIFIFSTMTLLLKQNICQNTSWFTFMTVYSLLYPLNSIYPDICSESNQSIEI